jgi:hypothetical protein
MNFDPKRFWLQNSASEIMAGGGKHVAPAMFYSAGQIATNSTANNAIIENMKEAA